MTREPVAAGMVLASALLLCLVLPSHGAPRAARRTTMAMPGPAHRVPAAARAAQNQACVTCHPETAAQWEGSLHQRSFTDQDVAIAMAREPRVFCRSCHAPEGDPLAVPSPEAAALGVACVTCHVPVSAELPAGAVLAAPTTDTTVAAPHPVIRDAAFAGTAACGGCHEFTAPRSPRLLMQSTLSEHRGSAFADLSCQSCHMPRDADGRRAHGFAASRDPVMLRAAVHAQAKRTGDEVVVTLTPAAVGHAFPTGDLFRRLAVELGHTDDEGEWIEVDARVLTRHIEDHRGSGRVQVADDRPGATSGATRVPLSAPGLAARSLDWRVVYERVDMDHPEDEDPRFFDRVVVAEGQLPPQTSP
jgi:Cytochrome c554 and c-prime